MFFQEENGPDVLLLLLTMLSSEHNDPSGGSAQPDRKVPDTFLQQGQVLTACVHLYPLTNSCLTSVLFKVAVVSSTGLLFKCPPTVAHNSPFPLLFLLCFPVTVAQEPFFFSNLIGVLKDNF